MSADAHRSLVCHFTAPLTTSPFPFSIILGYLVPARHRQRHGSREPGTGCGGNTGSMFEVSAGFFLTDLPLIDLDADTGKAS
jgi:hypothetical protein